MTKLSNWARYTIARKLNEVWPAKTDPNWHSIVCNLTNLLDDYNHVRKLVARQEKQLKTWRTGDWDS